MKRRAFLANLLFGGVALSASALTGNALAQQGQPEEGWTLPTDWKENQTEPKQQPIPPVRGDAAPPTPGKPCPPPQPPTAGVPIPAPPNTKGSRPIDQG